MNNSKKNLSIEVDLKSIFNSTINEFESLKNSRIFITGGTGFTRSFIHVVKI